MLGFGSANGIPLISEQTAMTLSAVWRSVSLVSGSVGQLPMRTLLTNRDGTRERSGSFLDNPGLDYQTPFEWKELATIWLLLHGNCYAQHIYNNAGALAGLNLIHPLAVCPEKDPSKVGGRKYTVTLYDGDTREFDGRTMTHIMGVSLDGVSGLSPITVARLSMATGLAGDRAANRQFVNGALVSGLVTPDADEDLTEDEAKTARKMIRDSITGVENAGDVAVINRRLKFQQWQLSAEDAQFLQSRTFQIDEVGRWYGVPPHLLGLTEKATSWGQGIAEQNRGLARYTLSPWTTRFEQRLSRLILGRKHVEFDYAQFVAPSPEDEIRLLLEQVNGGLITPNEARRVRNMPPVPGGDQLRLPAGAGAPPAAGDDDEDQADERPAPDTDGDEDA